MDAYADSRHFAVVYPEGINASWNVGKGFDE
jgi:poly(3-hydroxybutyrate) depolymerase